MLDAGDIEKGEGDGVWVAAADTRFSTERFGNPRFVELHQRTQDNLIRFLTSKWNWHILF